MMKGKQKTDGPPPHDWREGRRLRAWELQQAGWKQKHIAEALGVTAGAVSQWLKKARATGSASLRRQPAPGPTPRLTAGHREQLLYQLAAGAEAAGFRGEYWTTARVAALIEQRFGVRYHRAHVSRLLASLGWSLQKPVRRARQRDEAAIQAWREARWPELKKGP
jgi:transposase